MAGDIKDCNMNFFPIKIISCSCRSTLIYTRSRGIQIKTTDIVLTKILKTFT